MKVKTEYVVLVLLISALSLYLVVRKSGKTHYSLPEIRKIEKDDVSQLEIRRGDASITLVRENDTWRVGPEKFPADKNAVDGMLDRIAGLTLTALASESGNYSPYELDETKRIEVDAYQGEGLLRRIRVGKTASSERHTFVMIDDDPRVFHAEGNLHNIFSRSIPELRDKKVMPLDEKEIMEVTLRKAEASVTLVKNTAAPVSVDLKGQEGREEGPSGKEQAGETAAKERPVVPWTTSSGRAAKEEEIDEILRTLSHLECDGFIPGKKKEDFTSPIYSVSLKGRKTYTLSLFEKTGDMYPAISSENDYPFVVSEWKVKRIMKDPASLYEEEKKKK